MIEFLLDNFRNTCFYYKIEHFDTRSFSFRVNQKTPTWFYFVPWRRLSLMSYIFRAWRTSVCPSFSLNSMCKFGEIGQVLATFLTVVGNFGFRCTLLLCEMMMQINLRLCKEFGTLKATKYPSRKPLFALNKVLLCGLSSTIFTIDVFASIEVSHFTDEWSTGLSETK